MVLIFFCIGVVNATSIQERRKLYFYRLLTKPLYWSEYIIFSLLFGGKIKYINNSIAFVVYLERMMGAN